VPKFTQSINQFIVTGSRFEERQGKPKPRHAGIQINPSLHGNKKKEGKANLQVREVSGFVRGGGGTGHAHDLRGAFGVDVADGTRCRSRWRDVSPPLIVRRGIAAAGCRDQDPGRPTIFTLGRRPLTQAEKTLEPHALPSHRGP